MKRALYSLILLAICAFAVVVYAAPVEQEAALTAIEKAADGLVVPAEIAEGIVTVAFSNSAEAPSGPLLARLLPDVTEEAFNEALMSGGPMAAIPLVSLLGGVQIMPGQSVEATFNFQPGTHVVLDISGEVPDVKFFNVADGVADIAAAPEATVKVSLLDFAISLPLQIPAGEQVWSLENNGAQWHEMGIMKVDPETSLADFQASLMTEEGPSSEPPAFFWAPMSEGEQAWVTLDLEPGTYAVICFLPDIAGDTGHAHFQEGMVQIITVA
jgi:hypothetical protein